jgi:hypothetical protein
MVSADGKLKQVLAPDPKPESDDSALSSNLLFPQFPAELCRHASLKCLQ